MKPLTELQKSKLAEFAKLASRASIEALELLSDAGLPGALTTASAHLCSSLETLIRLDIVDEHSLVNETATIEGNKYKVGR